MRKLEVASWLVASSTLGHYLRTIRSARPPRARAAATPCQSRGPFRRVRRAPSYGCLVRFAGPRDFHGVDERSDVPTGRLSLRLRYGWPPGVLPKSEWKEGALADEAVSHLGMAATGTIETLPANGLQNSLGVVAKCA